MNDWEEIKSSLIKFRESKYFPYVRASLRGLLQYLFYAICFIITAINFEDGFHNNTVTEILPLPNVWFAVTTAVLSVLALNSTLTSFAIFDTKERKRYIAARRKAESKGENDAEKGLIEEIQTSPKEFWLEFGVLVALCFLFPVWHGYEDVVALIPFAQQLPGFVHRLILTAVFAAGSMILLLRAPYVAQQHWLKKQTEAFDKKGFVNAEYLNQHAYTKFKLTLRLIGLLILYVIGAALLCALLPVSYNAVIVFFMLFRELSVLLILAAIILLIIGRVLWKRLKFYFRLKRFTKKYGFRILEKKQFFLSMFRMSKSYNLAIEFNKKTYYCKIISTFRRKNRLQFLNDGRLIRFFGINLPTPQLMVHSRFAMGAVYIDRSHPDDREIFKIRRESRYAFECKEGGTKILILNPVPARVSLGGDAKKSADNGDRIGDYTVYTGGAFLRALKNNAVNDRDD